MITLYKKIRTRSCYKKSLKNVSPINNVRNRILPLFTHKIQRKVFLSTMAIHSVGSWLGRQDNRMPTKINKKKKNQLYIYIFLKDNFH